MEKRGRGGRGGERCGGGGERVGGKELEKDPQSKAGRTKGGTSDFREHSCAVSREC